MSPPRLRVPPELEDVATQIGEFIEYWGFKNVHGRIWAHVFLAKEPLDAAELIERLGISKALVSMSISDLLEYDVIQVAGKSSRGTVIYRSNPNLTTVITNVLRKRERRMLGRISSAVRLLKDLPTGPQGTIAVAESRVEILEEMVRSAETTLDAILQMHDMDLTEWSHFNEIADPRSDEGDGAKSDS